MTTDIMRAFAARTAQTMGAAALAAVLVVGGAGMAQAGGSGGNFGGGGFGGYASTSDRMDDDSGMMAEGWMGTVNRIVENFYIGVRGKGFSYLDDAETGNASLSNYEAPAANDNDATDFTDLLNGYQTEPTELTGGFAIALGYDIPIDLPGGALRAEFEYDYQIYTNEACFPRTPEGVNNTVPLLPLAGLPEGDRSSADDISAARRIARAAFRAGTATVGGNTVTLVGTQCEDVNNPVHGFLGNIFYDIDLASALDMMGADGGMLSGLAFNIGVGFGYQLVDAEVGPVTIAAAGSLPQFDPSGTDTSIEFDGGGTDENADITAAAVELAESGFLLPIYGGFSYSLEDMANLPVVIEATYRYDAIAPDGVGAHTFGGGVRYHF